MDTPAMLTQLGKFTINNMKRTEILEAFLNKVGKLSGVGENHVGMFDAQKNLAKIRLACKETRARIGT